MVSVAATAREAGVGDDGARFVAGRARRWLDAAPASAPVSALSLIDLSGDELERPTPAHIVAAAAAALARGETHYTARPGILPLRRSVARVLAAEGHPAYHPVSEVLIANGAQEGLYVAIQMLVRPGDEVLLADPGYPMFREAVRFAGGVAVSVPLDAAGGWGMTAAAIAARVTPHTRLLVFASPDNPTGGVTTGAELAAIADLAVAHDLRVLVDESYTAFRFTDAPHTPVAALPGMHGRTITVGSLSKPYAMGGWRVGYVVGEASLLHDITDFKLALSICAAAPSQWAAVAALDGPQDTVNAARATVAARRAALLPALAAMGLPTGESDGGWFVFADIRTTGMSSAACAALFHARAGVRVLPGNAFGPGGEGYVRFGTTRPVAEITEAMARLAPIVASLRMAGAVGAADGRESGVS